MSSKKQYKDKIIDQMMELAIYNENYEILVDTLAETCHLRDKNLTAWRKDGFNMVCEYTNKAGATNIQKSPYYLNNIQFNDLILKYCKELGLSPSGIKKLGSPTKDDKDELAQFIENFK